MSNIDEHHGWCDPERCHPWNDEHGPQHWHLGPGIEQQLTDPGASYSIELMQMRHADHTDDPVLIAITGEMFLSPAEARVLAARLSSLANIADVANGDPWPTADGGTA